MSWNQPIFGTWEVAAPFLFICCHLNSGGKSSGKVPLPSLRLPLISFRPDLAPIQTDFLPDRDFSDECASWERKWRTCAMADG